MTLRGRFPWPVVLLALGAAGATRTPALLIVAAGGLVAWALSELTARLALVAVDVALEVEPRRPVPGETVVATRTLPHRSPSTSVARGDAGSPRASSLRGRPGARRAPRSATVAPRGHERVTPASARVPDRGAYAIGPLALRSGDWLGFVGPSGPRDRRRRRRYPQPLAVTDRHRPSLRRSRRPRRRGLVPDPLLPRRARAPARRPAQRDPLSSARLGALRPALRPGDQLAVFLVNVASYEQYWIIADPEAVELVIAATAELVRSRRARDARSDL